MRWCMRRKLTAGYMNTYTKAQLAVHSYEMICFYFNDTHHDQKERNLHV